MYLKVILLFMVNLISAHSFNSIDDFKWNNRLLIINEDDKTNFLIERDNLRKEFDERDIVIISVKGNSTFIHNSRMSKYFTESLFKKIKTINIRQYFILIGKDGQIKNYYNLDTKVQKIFSDIDKMPMRRYEMENLKK